MIPLDNLRCNLIASRKAQDEYTVRLNSHKICDKLVTYIKPGMCVGFYMAMADEVQLESLRKQVCEYICCAIPKITGHGTMSFYQVDDETKLVKNTWGILEPVKTKEILPNAFDIIIVPMVGFDEQKHRIGHGAGFYDRYLAKTSALKIGVAFELQKCATIPTYPHDIDMDIILTEDNIYT